MKNNNTFQNPIILIGNHAIDDAKLFFNSFKYERLFILVDNNTKKYCLDYFFSTFPGLRKSIILEVEVGESSKSIENIIFLSEELIKKGAEKRSLLINLGGGVICDLGGFLASIFNRGIKYINVPTTLLSQVDASIGGKTAINFKKIKNKLGAFYNPELILILPFFLHTLSKNEILSGFGEIFKYGLVADQKIWNKIQKISFNIDDHLEELISDSISIKKEIVKKDLFDDNLRQILNFGHTIGHAVESVYFRNPFFSHGICVVIGIICESFISNKTSKLSDQTLSIITKKLFSNFCLKKISHLNKILSFITSDKKNKNRKIHITTISEIGKANYNIFVDKKIIIDSINFYNSFHE